MINTITSSKIKKLQNQQSCPSVSIYLPMLPGHSNAYNNRITYKNSLRVVKRMIRSNSLPACARRDTGWEIQARKLMRNALLWESQSRGLAVFITSNSVQAFRVNHKFETRIFVGIKFMTEPLVYIEPDAVQTYYVLALSKNATRLFEFSEESSKEVYESAMPHNLNETLNVDEPNKGLQTHMVGLGGSARSEAFHGQGYYKDQRKKLLDKFLRRVSDKVQSVLAKSGAPLYVIGTSPVVAKYNKLNKYKKTAQTNVHMNVDYLDASALRQLLMAKKVLKKGV